MYISSSALLSICSNIIFLQAGLPKHFTYKYPFPFEELNFEMEDGDNINAIYLKYPKAGHCIFISRQ